MRSCYASPSLVLAAIFAVVYAIFNRAINHFLFLVGVGFAIVICLAIAALSAFLIVRAGLAIRRRRSATGACTTCSLNCQQAQVPAPAKPALTRVEPSRTWLVTPRTRDDFTTRA